MLNCVLRSAKCNKTALTFAELVQSEVNLDYFKTLDNNLRRFQNNLVDVDLCENFPMMLDSLGSASIRP